MAAGQATSSPVTLTVPVGGVPRGSFLAIACWSTWNGLAGSIADSRGNVYTMDSPSGNVVVFSCPVTTALVAGDTITYTFGGNFANINVAVFTGVGLFRATGADGSGTSSVTGVIAGDLVVGYGDLEGGGSGTSHNDTVSPWSALFTNVGYTGGAAQAQLSGSYQVAPASGTVTWTASSGTGTSIAVAYHHG